MKAYLIAAASLVLLASAPVALAQTAWVEIDDDDLMVATVNLSVDDLEDKDVYTADGEEIGEVEEVLGAAQDEPTALALEVGGFLGIGEREVIVPLDQLTITEDRVVLDMTRDEIEALEDWDD